jgi:hypothetical protein
MLSTPPLPEATDAQTVVALFSSPNEVMESGSRIDFKEEQSEKAQPPIDSIVIGNFI